MRHDVLRFRFLATVSGGGTIVMPEDAARRFPAGAKVAVSIAPAERGAIDEEEVAAIAALQAEPAELVRKCLEAQGAFPRNAGTGRKPARAGSR